MARSHADWESSARAALKDSGHRTGGAREAVLQQLAGQECCLSAQEICDRLRRTAGRVGIASVYRALDLLHDLGMVQRVEIGDGGARFEPVIPGGEHHHHAVCARCGQVTAFQDEHLERQLERLADELRHTMSAHDIVIRGNCAKCGAT
jgi:Fur family transcriptional regulator, ferric uptake regulator